MTVFMYSAVKFSHLISRHNPNLGIYDIEDGMSETTLNLNEKYARFAFTFEKYQSP